MYTYHKTHREYYYLRCKDRQCFGTAKYNQINGNIEEMAKCSKLFENHNYVRESRIKKKIEENNMTSEDLENNLENQEIYFKYIHEIHPTIGYYDIALQLNEKYNINTILYKQQQFNTYKNNQKKINNFNNDREQRLDNILFDKKHLLKTKIEFYTKEKPNEKNVIRIFATEETLKLLNDDEITQYFIDGTYKCVPHSINTIKVLILLIAFNAKKNNFELCLIATLTKEDKNTFIQFYTYLKNQFDFNPKFITCDFAIANIEAIKFVFGEENITIITCFFHLIQNWWKRAGRLGMRKKDIIKKSRNLIFNLKLLPFMELNNARKFYLKIKEYFNEYEFNNFY